MKAHLLIPVAEVPRRYAQAKPEDTIAISQGATMLTFKSRTDAIAIDLLV